MSHTQRDELYQQLILEHNRKPKNFKKLEPHSHYAEGFNPLCGDHYHIYMNVNEDGTIQELTFDGEGCAISKASSSMMTAFFIGKTATDVKPLIEEFQKLITGKLDPSTEEHHLGKLTIFSGVQKYPSRIKCAVLSWHAVKAALDNEKTISTE
jgi:nitrogen fixation NifU-like protein